MKKILVAILFFSVLFSCKEEQPKEEYVTVPSAQETADMNKAWNQEEHEIINQFVARKGWEMTMTTSGLRYLIYKEGSGDKAEPGMRAMIEYSLTLLDGTEVFSSRDTGTQPFLIERDNVEAGLLEGITYMKVGDRAKIILPPYLAHGLMGNQENIPPMATLVFDIRLLGLSK